MPKQFTLNLTKKELAILEHCLELLGNEMLAEAEETQKKYRFYTPSKRRAHNSLVIKFLETKNGG